MERFYQVVLKECPLDTGLTKTDMVDMYDLLTETEGIPIEIQGENSSAMGLISISDADAINYDYSMLEEFIKPILNNMDLENPTCEYQLRICTKEKHHDLQIWMSR